LRKFLIQVSCTYVVGFSSDEKTVGPETEVFENGYLCIFNHTTVQLACTLVCVSLRIRTNFAKRRRETAPCPEKRSYSFLCI